MINLIAALGLDREIGYKNQLLCDLPNDMKRFRQLTTGNIVIMGRKTFQSIGKPLPNRKNIILTHKPKSDFPSDVYVYHSVEDILRQYENYAEKQVEVFVIGGSSTYKQFLPYADRIYLTIINNKFPHADSYFPRISLDEWRVIEHIENKADDKNMYDYDFVTYERKTK